MYKVKVVDRFSDKQNDGMIRSVGDVFEIEDTQRFLELSGNNKRKHKFIELIEATKREGESKGNKIYIHQGHLFSIGGIETFLFNFVKQYKDRDITIVTALPDINQIVRLSQYANIVIDHNQKLECDVMILGNYDGDKILHRVKAKYIYQMIHADLEGMNKTYNGQFSNWHKHNKVKEVICVSNTAAEGLKKVGGSDSKVIYNILDNDYQEEDGMTFITLSRATKEKGINRIIAMAEKFKEQDKKFTWLLCCSITQADAQAIAKIKSMPEFIIIPPSEDNKKFIKFCDYLVQLSDTESFCYSAFEALQRNVPVILTDFPEAKNIIDDGENGYIVDMDLNNLDVDKIFNHKPTNMYYIDRCNKDDWEKVFKGEF